jgi:hypothetical protein
LSETVGLPKATVVVQFPIPSFDVLAVVILAGQVMVGDWLSTTVTVKLQEILFPAASVTSNVLVVVPIGKVAPETKPAICVVVAPKQLSVPTGVVYVTAAPQVPIVLLTEILAGQVIVGA